MLCPVKLSTINPFLILGFPSLSSKGVPCADFSNKESDV